MCHPDYRLDNLFFSHGSYGIEVGVIDFGRIARLPGGFATAMFLAGESGMTGEPDQSKSGRLLAGADGRRC